MPERQPPPFADRMDASLAFTGHLLSALVGVPVELAERVAAAWFDAIRDYCDRNYVIVFDTCVVGRPGPLLLEVAHHARGARAASHQAAEDLHALDDAPPLFERVIAALAGGQDVERVVGWPAIDAALASTLDRERDPICGVVDVIVGLEVLVGTWARGIRIGDAAVMSTSPTSRTLSREAAA